MRQRKGTERSEEEEKAGPCGRGVCFQLERCTASWRSATVDAEQEGGVQEKDTPATATQRAHFFPSVDQEREALTWSKDRDVTEALPVQESNPRPFKWIKRWTRLGCLLLWMLRGRTSRVSWRLLFHSRFFFFSIYFLSRLIGLSFGGETGNPFAY